MNKHFCFYCMSPVNEDGSCPVCGLTAGAYQPAPHHIPPGTILLNRYLFGRVLGEGGFGITYIACDLRLDLKVAIKEYFPTDKANRHSAASLDVTSYTGTATSNYESCKRKFLSEARTMAKMDKQPEVVSVRDFFELNNTAYIVMEFVDGTNFRELVKQQGGKIPAQQLLTTIEPLFDALSAMHAAGLVHRDISPDNLMLEHGKVRLLDFGCARESATGTDTLTIALKHGFAPIEQYTNHGQGPWTDIYALAGTIYFCITGKAPVRSTDRLLGDELILPSKLGIDLTRQQEKALLRAMAIQPRRRFQTMEEFRAALYALDEDPIYISGEPEPSVQNGQPDTVDIQEVLPEPAPAENIQSTSAVTVAAKTEQAEQAVQESQVLARNKPKYFIPVIAGAVAALALIVGLIWAGNSGDQREHAGGNDTTIGTEFLNNETNPPVNEGAQPLTLETDTDYVGNYARFLDALADPDVSEIHIVGGECLEALEYVHTTISKPVYLEDCSLISYFPVEIVSGGHLFVNSGWTCQGYLRTWGGGKVTIQENAQVNLMGMVWLGDETDLDWQGGELTYKWVFNEHEAEATATHVKSWEELQYAMEQTSGNIVIDSDITVSATTWGVYDRSIIIKPGVTVTSQAEDFTVRGNLINYGILNLADQVDVIDQGGHLVNFGTVMCSAVYGLQVQDDGSALVNLGVLETSSQRLWLNDDTFVANMGQMHANEGISCAGVLLNSGWITSSINQYVNDYEETVIVGGIMVNWGSVSMDGQLNNYSYILNGGDLYAEKIYNVGFFDECTHYICPEGQASFDSIDNGRGILTTKNPDIVDVGNGIVDLQNNVPSGDEDSIYACLKGQRYVEAATQEDLMDHADDDYDWIVVTEDITYTQDLDLHCNLLILPGRTLNFEDASLHVLNTTVIVCGSLGGEYLSFEEGSRLLANTGSRWSVTGRTLAMQSGSVCYIGDASSVEMENLVAAEGSVVVVHGGILRCTQQVHIDNSSRLMLADQPQRNSCTLETPDLQLSGSRLVNLSKQELSNTSINMENSSMDILRDLTLLESDLKLNQGSDIWCLHSAPLRIRTNSTLTNEGTIEAGGEAWLDCNTVNTGRMYYGTLHVSGSFVNNGTVRLNELVDYGNAFTGNAPEKWD